MPRFKYVAKTKDAKTIKDIGQDVSRKNFISQLRSRGLFVISVKEVQESGKPSKKLFTSVRTKRSSIKLQDLTYLARNLATTLSAGLTLLRSLEMIAHQAESSKMENILNHCAKQVRGGSSFGEAVGKYPDVFSDLWVGIVRVGETSGNLPFVLDKLADYLELKMEFERKIKSALVYPVILAVVATVAVIFFLKFIFPKFAEIFTQFDIELPFITQILFKLSKLLEKHFLLVIVGIIAVVYGFIYLKKLPSVKKFLDKVVFKIPVIGKLTELICLERFTSTLQILLSSGLPLVYTVNITAQSIGNTLFREKLDYVQKRIRDGSPLSEELRNVEIFPLLVSEMAKIGEETGTMPEVFEKISLHYRKDLTTRVERLVAAFEPLMIVFMGIVIGGIVISLFLPLFKISTLSH